jgi:hypothetical protein
MEKKINHLHVFDNLDEVNKRLASGWEFIGFFNKKVAVGDGQWEDKPHWVLGCNAVHPELDTEQR